MNDLLTVLLFFLPAGLSNMAPVLGNKIPGWNHWGTPLDFGVTFRGTRIFGPNKTWRGLVGGTLLSALVGYILFNLLGLQLSRGNYLLLGAAMGFGALFGDAVESFFKRQVGVAAGNSWFPFDQVDYIVGGLLFSLPFIRFSAGEYVAIFATYFGLHLAVSYVGYLLHLKDKPI